MYQMQAAYLTSRHAALQCCFSPRLRSTKLKLRVHVAALGDGADSGSSSGAGGTNLPGTAAQLKPPLAPPASSKLLRRIPHSTGDAGSSAVTVASEAPPPQAPAQQGTPWYGVVALAALAALICSIDRAAISVAILPMSDQYHWNDSTKGAINSAFYAGYTITNLVGGYLAATMGSKRVLGAGVVVWSSFTMLTPVAAATQYLPLLMGTRFMMGCGEGTAYPCVQSVVKGWVPPDSRSRALTLVYSGGQLGTILALLTAPIIIEHLGWPAVFVVYGSLGLVWMALWQPLVGDVPPIQEGQQKQEVEEAEEVVAGTVGVSSKPRAGSRAKFITRSSSDVSSSSSSDHAALAPLPGLLELPWRRFLTNRAFIGIMMAHSAFGMGHYIMLSWLPTFYHQAFGLGVSESATLSVLPWLATVVVSSSSGWLADWLTNEGHLDTTRTRKAMQTVGAVAPAVCLLALADAHDSHLGLGMALALLTGGVALGGFQSAGFASNHQDIAGRYAPILFGFTNALSSLVGSASVYATGWMLDAGWSWSAVFQVVAVAYLAGAAGYLVYGSGERQFE